MDGRGDRSGVEGGCSVALGRGACDGRQRRRGGKVYRAQAAVVKIASKQSKKCRVKEEERNPLDCQEEQKPFPLPSPTREAFLRPSLASPHGFIFGSGPKQRPCRDPRKLPSRQPGTRRQSCLIGAQRRPQARPNKTPGTHAAWCPPPLGRPALARGGDRAGAQRRAPRIRRFWAAPAWSASLESSGERRSLGSCEGKGDRGQG